MPTKSMPQPHWKTTVRMPNAAIAVRKFVIAAWIGMSSERNATSSTSMLSSRIVTITSGRRSEISAARSTFEAVEPPTNAVTPCPEFCGITVERSWRTRSAVAGAEGAGRAVTPNVAAPALAGSDGGAALRRDRGRRNQRVALGGDQAVLEFHEPGIGAAVVAAGLRDRLDELIVQSLGLLLLLLRRRLQLQQRVLLLLQLGGLLLQRVRLLLERVALRLQSVGLGLQRVC